MQQTKFKYKFSDFEVVSRQDRIYSDGDKRTTLTFVTLRNNVTGKIFKDWVRPIQLRSTKSLNNLIKWD